MSRNFPFPLPKLPDFYPEQSRDETKLEHALINAIGNPSKSLVARKGNLDALVREVNRAGAGFGSLDEQGLAQLIAGLKLNLTVDGPRRDHVVRTFAAVREVSSRRLGKRHFDVQLRGGFVLLWGMVAEMEAGEGKTITATLAACTSALSGVPVHVVTVNDYLACRDAEITRPIYEAFGLSVGVIAHGMGLDQRRAAYACDITYCTNKELVFDYLKDRLQYGRRPGNIQLAVERLKGGGDRSVKLMLRGLPFAIVDEADSVLIDEARTPLIISGRSSLSAEADAVYHKAIELASLLDEGQHFTLEPVKRNLELSSQGIEHLAEITSDLGGIWCGKRRREHLITQALTALHIFHRDRDYLVKDNRVQIIDEYTGRLMGDRSWELGLHQLIEAKEGTAISSRNETISRISYQRFFRRYCHLAGMTGTAHEVSAELWSVYRLTVVRIQTNHPLIRRPYPFRYFRRREEKWQAIVERVRELHRQGRPVLIGTRSVTVSEEVSRLLTESHLEHVILNARQDSDEAAIISRAGEFGRITVATNMAGRGTDIMLGEGVREIGGLHVIATELHEARRIDRQLFGRCGRQGDPGSYEAIISFEDEIFAQKKGALLGFVAQRWGGGKGVLRLLSGCYARMVQRWIQRRNYHIRRELLRFDEQIESSMAFTGTAE